MQTIIKSLLDKKDSESFELLPNLLEQPVPHIVTNREHEMLQYLKDFVDNDGETPSEDMFLKKWPEYKVPLESGEALAPKDLRLHLGALVRDRSNKWKSLELMKIASKVKDEGMTSETLEEIRTKIQVDDTALQDDEEKLDTFESFKKKFDKNMEKPLGIDLGIADLREYIAGVPNGSLVTIAGYTGAGKSLFGTNIAYNNAKKNKYNFLILNFEMTKEQTTALLVCRHSLDPKFDKPPIQYSKIRNRTATDEEYEHYMEVAKDYFDNLDEEGNLNGLIVVKDESDLSNYSPAEIREICLRVNDEMIEKTGYPLDAIIVDNINLLRFNPSGNNNNQSDNSTINMYASFFRQMCLNFYRDPSTGVVQQVSVFLLAQINRTSWKKAAKADIAGRYDLTCLADANELERASVLILTSFLSEELKLANEAHVGLLKSRFGPVAPDPVTCRCDCNYYLYGDGDDSFNDSLGDMSNLEDVFGSGDITSMFN